LANITPIDTIAETLDIFRAPNRTPAALDPRPALLTT
jgi:hypothetical protein